MSINVLKVFCLHIFSQSTVCCFLSFFSILLFCPVKCRTGHSGMAELSLFLKTHVSLFYSADIFILFFLLLRARLVVNSAVAAAAAGADMG